MRTHRQARVLLALGLMFFALSPALQYGSIWDHRAHPTPDVRVVLRDGSVYTGTLSREWSKDWVLYLPDDAKVLFDDHGYDLMEFKAPQHRREDSAFGVLLKAWRSFLPLALVSWACIALLLSAAVHKAREHS